MPARAPTKPKPKTWVDYMPPDAPEPPVLSRDELLEAVRRFHGIEIAPTTLAWWRHKNVIPRPVARRHNGVTQAVYPLWYVDALTTVHNLQQSSTTSLAEISEWMREQWPLWARGEYEGMSYTRLVPWPRILRDARYLKNVATVTVTMRDAEGRTVVEETQTVPD